MAQSTSATLLHNHPQAQQQMPQFVPTDSHQGLAHAQQQVPQLVQQQQVYQVNQHDVVGQNTRSGEVKSRKSVDQ